MKIAGKNACRLSDKMMMNHGNTACLGGYFVKPTTLSPAESQLWDDCEAQHDKYKTSQAEQASIVDKGLHQRVHSGGSLKDRMEFCELLGKRIKVAKRLHSERKKYIDMGCDKFDWSNNGTTQQEREDDHRGELENVSDSIKNMYEQLNRFTP